MNIRFIAVAGVAIAATSLVFAAEPAPAAKQAQPSPRAQTLLVDVVAGMRDVLRAVVPEIALPAIDVRLPALDSRGR